MHLDKGAGSFNWIKAPVSIREKTGKAGCAPPPMLYPGTVGSLFLVRGRDDDTMVGKFIKRPGSSPLRG